MKPETIRIALVAAASLAVGSWLTGVFAQQEPSAQPAVSSPAARTTPATQPAFVPPLAPGASATRGESGAEPADEEDGGDTAPAPGTPGAVPAGAAPATHSAAVAAVPATGPASAIPSTEPAVAHADGSAAPTTSPSAGTPESATRPSGFGSSKSGKSSRYGSSGRDRETASDPTTRPSTPEAVTIPIPPSKPLDKKYEVLLARSLFSKERPRTFAPPPPNGFKDPSTVKPPEPPAPEKSMAVRGMSIEGEGDDDDACYAFIEDLPLKMMKRVKVGDKVARGVIVEVTLADLVYEYEGKRTRVPIGHTLDGAAVPAITWTTYTPVATAPPPGSSSPGSSSRGGDSRGGDSRNGDSRGGDSRGGDSRSGDSRGGDRGDRGGDRGSSGGPPAASSTPGAPEAVAPGAPAAPAPGAPAATGGTPVTAPAPAPAGGADDLLERMRKRREQESGR